MEKASINLIKSIKKQIRENRHLLFLDNIKIINDALKSDNFKPVVGFVSEESLGKDFPFPTYLVSKSTLESLVDVKTPQGVCVMIEYTQHIVKKPKTNFLILDQIQDPGNAGTLIRTAVATGFSPVILVDSVRVTNPKLVRSTVGAIFNADIYEMSKSEFIAYQKEWNLSLLKADMNGENIFETSFSSPVGVIIGNEGNGVCDELSSLCTKSVKIPMQKGIESLNAGVSGAIIMYQINKNLLK